MNTLSDKTKRKSKPKRSRRSWIIILLLLIILVALVGAYFITLPQPKRVDPVDMDAILNPPDNDPFTPFCEFESDIQLHVSGNNFHYIIRPSDNRMITLPDFFNIPHHIAGSPYVWASVVENHSMMNLETGDIVVVEESIGYNIIYPSRTNRYQLKFMKNDNNIQDLIIYDGQTQTQLIETQTTNKEAYWSESDKYLLLFNPTAQNHTQLVDIETFTFSNANLPSDIDRMKGWIDDEQILYETPAGRLYTWSVLSGDIKEFTDIQFNGYYHAGGIQHTPNLRLILYLHSWIGGIDSENIFHLFDVNNPDFHERISMKGAKSFVFSLSENAIRFKYDTNPITMTIYYPNEAMRSVDVVGVNGHPSLSISPDSKYGLYNPNESQSDHIVQNFASGETMTIDTDSVSGAVQWEEIDGISYLKYTIPHEDRTHVLYLWRPDTKDRCKLGTFYTHYIKVLA